MTKLLFVCSGNICRSPLAHGMFENLCEEKGVRDLFFVESAGTGAWHVGENADPRMRQTATRHGWELDHLARKLLVTDFSTYDFILGMDAGHIATMRTLVPSGAKAKVLLFRDFDPEGKGDVPDPYYDGDDSFEQVYQMVERTCIHLLQHLLKENG